MEFPGINCGSCGFKTCTELETASEKNAELIKRCLYVKDETKKPINPKNKNSEWTDVLGREFDFILDHFPEDPGPREIVLPHNPMLTREMEIKIGDKMIGRPLGMSCGCPVTHCGIVLAVDHKTGVMTWAVTGPLAIRGGDYKDIGYYSAQGYEGLVKETNAVLEIGRRYFFKPRRCMLQWRHSGLINYINKVDETTYQVRLEGLFIG